MSGFVRLDRGAFDHPILRDPLRFRAWFWLVANACWKPSRYDVNGKVVELQRGQVCASLRQLADAWGMSKSATERFITRLETETMIGTATGTGRYVITICNYDKYNPCAETGGTATGTPSGTAAGQQRDIKEQGNKGTSDPNGSQGRKRPASSFEKPEDVEGPVWRDFGKLRDKQKAPVTETVINTIRREAESVGWSLNDALTECVARSWRGFKAAWVEPKSATVVAINPDAGKMFARYQAGEISFEEFDRSRRESEPRRKATGPPRSIGQLVAGMGGGP